MTLRSLHLHNSEFKVQNFNNDFLLIHAKEEGTLATLGELIYEKKFDFIDEVIVTEREICLKLNGLFDAPKIDLFATLQPSNQQAVNTYRLPIYFSDHEDWQDVSRVTGLSKEEIIHQLLATDFTVAMFGFLPGFIYLDGLPKALHVPRKSVPAKYVKANSVAIGGKYLGLYALDSPGGWHVIGQVPVSILQIPQLPPLPLNLEDRIRCTQITSEEFAQINAQQLNLIAYNA
ncbi:carboxyltransferase domain-containing protein [Lewinella cohaerens]|uniref:carboxyltransferase domain-containing protein n=1 Tax=Lewinella cohaerens TaxID=70995 RepID=UPI00036440E7|nr:carboxyltransferase domain-containing protein [Lewinella cohaerens]